MKLSNRIKNFIWGQKSNNEQTIKSDVRYCCICGAPEDQVKIIIRGGANTYICDRCATMIHYQMDELYKYVDNAKEKETQETDSSKTMPKTVKIPTPLEIKQYLDEYVIGQDEAKKKLAIGVYNHYKRIFQPADDVEIGKSNILLLGETGSGKSELCKTIAKLLDVPFTIVDANSFTQAGYVGEDVESILSRLYQVADGDISKVERGIVMLDEIDKIAKKGDNPSITRDVSGEGVQQALLKIIEGAKVKISPEGGRKHPEKQMIEIDTTNILFICAGAFVGIERIIGSRMNTRAIGFSNKSEAVDKNNLLQYLTSEDVRQYGLIPELVGRLPIITHVNSLTKDDLKKILVEPKNAIVKQYKKLFAMDGIQLVFQDEALDYIVENALPMKIGARALRSIMEEIMSEYMFDAPSSNKKKIVITKAAAQRIFEAKHKTDKKILANA